MHKGNNFVHGTLEIPVMSPEFKPHWLSGFQYKKGVSRPLLKIFQSAGPARGDYGAGVRTTSPLNP
jgi:hypothetical protein